MPFSDCRYCSKCHAEVNRAPDTPFHGWCERCGVIVDVTSCKVPYWVIAVTLALLWAVLFSKTLGPLVFG